MYIPKGQIHKPKPDSIVESVSNMSNDRIKSITKTAIKDYIASFFSTDGQRRLLLGNFSPASLNYITDKSYEENDKDLTVRYMQLAIFFEQLKQHLPFILVIDNGIRVIKSGLGQNIDSYKLVKTRTQVTIPILRELSINVVIGTGDEETTDILASALSIIFNELHYIGGCDRLSGNPRNGDSWEVRVSYRGVEQGPTQHQQIADDPIDSIWWAEFTLNEVWFEDVITLDFGHITAQLDPPVVDEDLTSNVSITFPDTIQLNSPYPLLVTGHDGNIVITIDNPNIANYDSQARNIIPRKPGVFVIRVTEKVAKGSVIGLLAEKVVEVIF